MAFRIPFFRHRGKRIATCPETHAPVSVEINAVLAEGNRFVITACSRWPERAGCDQACAPQIAASPEETLVRSIVAHWYAERTCAYCATPIREIGGPVFPGLLTMDGRLREWKDVAAEELPRILENAVAVCARCELVESFRAKHPELVIERSRELPRPRHFAIGEASRAVY